MHHRQANLVAYFHVHQYCKQRLEICVLNKTNKVSPADRLKIERETRKNNTLWRKTRKTRITASIAHYVVRTCRTQGRTGKFDTSFLKQHILNLKIRSKAIDWGVKNEEAALREYSNKVGEKFSKCGIFVDSSLSCLSATPDGINESRSVIVEIKCPYSVRFKKPEATSFLQNNSLKKNHMYYTQVQIQMYVTKIFKCDFVVWTPSGIFIEPILYNEVYVNECLQHIETYFKDVFSMYYFEITQEDNV